MPDTAYRFIIADDHPLFRGALRQTLETQYPDARIDEAGTLEDATACLEEDGDVDLILLDLTMPGMRGFSGLMYLRAQYAGVPVVIVSANDSDQDKAQAFEAGANDYLIKPPMIEDIEATLEKTLKKPVQPQAKTAPAETPAATPAATKPADTTAKAKRSKSGKPVAPKPKKASRAAQPAPPQKKSVL